MHSAIFDLIRYKKKIQQIYLLESREGFLPRASPELIVLPLLPKWNLIVESLKQKFKSYFIVEKKGTLKQKF